MESLRQVLPGLMLLRRQLLPPLLLLLIARAAQSSAAGRAASNTSAAGWPKVRTIRNLETLWEVPEQPRGVLFVAHGCSHSGSDWWPPSPRCRHCLGLPEEMAVRRAALRRGYAVIAVSSFDRDTKCWHNTAPSRSEDLQRLPGVLAEVAAEDGLEGIPLYVFGVSSGGGIVLRLAQIMPAVQLRDEGWVAWRPKQWPCIKGWKWLPLEAENATPEPPGEPHVSHVSPKAQGVVAQVVPARPNLLVAECGDSSGEPESSDGGSSSRRAFPPVLFVHMAQRDPDFALQVEEAIQFCSQAGIPAAEIRVAPWPVTPRLLRRSRLISARQAVAAVAALQSAGLLDQRGFLVGDPRGSDSWRQALQPVLGELTDG
ncbi:hypothetical protein ABPG75_012833 [Micractinium tetrahymenae]